MFSKYLIMMLVTGFTGVISGFMWLIPNGIMGGILGICLSAGTAWLGLKQHNQGGELSLRQVLGAGFVSGLSAGILMAWVGHSLAGVSSGDFGPPNLPFWAPLIMGILYGIAIHWSYYQRRFSIHPLRQTMFYACGICFLLKTAGTFIYLCITEKSHGETSGMLIGSVMLSLLGAVPFAFMWVIVASVLDPAWSCPIQKHED